MATLRQKLISYAKKQYGTAPDRPFARAPEYQVLRHGDSGKWFALFMDVPANKLGRNGDNRVNIVDLKCDKLLSGSLLDGVGILPGYHMSRSGWITVVLDGTVPFREIKPLLDMSWSLTQGGGRRRISRWLIPANPRYYDIEEGIAENDQHIFRWKQSSSIEVGDTVYIYMAAPVSAIRYKCLAVEVNIPWEYKDENVRMSRVMKLKLLRRFDGPVIGRELMAKRGVFAVRGPRSMLPGLEEDIRALYPEPDDVAGSRE